MKIKNEILEIISFAIGITLFTTGFFLLLDGLGVSNITTKYEQEKQAQIELYGYYDKNKEILTEYKKTTIQNNWKIYVGVPGIILGGIITTFAAASIREE